MPIGPKLVGLTTVLLVIVAGVAWILLNKPSAPAPEIVELPDPEPVVTVPTSTQSVIGTSVEGRVIEAFTFGTGPTNILLVGGIHGGYEANSVHLADAMVQHFSQNSEIVPSDLTVHIIPNLNPDGYAKALDTTVTYTDAEKRFNANGVDLNRNFDCRWQPESSWRSEVVSAGSAPFSEPEAVAFRDYVQKINPQAAVFWHSRANNVYGSECNNGIVSPETLAFVGVYAKAGGYGEVPVFDAYTVTGAAEDWLASLGIPSVTVELETRDDIEWSRNLAGTIATLEHFSDATAR